MTQGRVRRFCAGIAVACAVALAVACGTYRPNRIEFRFTPIPVIVSDVAAGTPISIDPITCEVFTADQVGVSIDVKERKAFERWLDDIGFVILQSFSNEPIQPVLIYNVQVPSGSVPDAITVIRKQRGVRTADRNGFAWDGTPPGTRLGCETPTSTPTPI